MYSRLLIFILMTVLFDCYGAAHFADQSQEYAGVACRKGTYAVSRGRINDTYVCAVAHTLESHLKLEHLQNAANELYAYAHKTKELDFNLVNAAFPETRTFSLGKEVVTQLTLSVFVLCKNGLKDAAVYTYKLQLIKGLLPLAEGQMYSSPDVKPLNISRKSHICKSVGQVMFSVKATLTSGKSLDEAADIVFDMSRNLKSENVVVLIDTKSWNNRKKAK